MRNSLTIALAMSLVLGAAAAWGSCAVPHRITQDPAGSPVPLESVEAASVAA
jgi:hypothetical protein